MTTAQVYWLTRLDGIHGALKFGFGAGLALVFIVLFFGHMFADLSTDTVAEEKAAKLLAWRAARIFSVIAVLSGISSVFVPTTKELIAIYGISYLSQNADAREIPAEALKVLNQKLKDMSDSKD